MIIGRAKYSPCGPGMGGLQTDMLAQPGVPAALRPLTQTREHNSAVDQTSGGGEVRDWGGSAARQKDGEVLLFHKPSARIARKHNPD